MIQIANVTKRYGDKTAVDNLALTVEPGQMLAMLGPNGAGKTTTIKMIVGLLRATAGTVQVDGRDMSLNDVEARRVISYIPDQPYLYDKLTGREFLYFVLDMYGYDRRDSADRLQECIDTFAVEAFCDQLIETYSHGMKQRLAFAAALLHEPKVLVVDEPMVGLDPKSARTVKDVLRKQAESGTAVFMSTHTLAIAEEVADVIGIIDQGRLIWHGPLDELRSKMESDASLEELFLRLTEEESQPGT